MNLVAKLDSQLKELALALLELELGGKVAFADERDLITRFFQGQRFVVIVGSRQVTCRYFERRILTC